MPSIQPEKRSSLHLLSRALFEILNGPRTPPMLTEKNFNVLNHPLTHSPRLPEEKGRLGKTKTLYAFIRDFRLLTRPNTFYSDLN